ncbi:uncharacterized serine-rich protein C215.13-like isoform X2 [Perca fluviatilis]|uniref:uncharacterized serine-rich protein C215.13-like isoform X2 n=1 Tax=Perca fluviatilis TaxID=8168 RepID=UPI001962830A|nr:uncharacterized serine-rich protein C215.13-like isoform X2 [Perca fluviatilis]
MVLENKTSARVEAGQRRVLDEATRQRRLTRQLEALEKDNFQTKTRRGGRREATTSSSASGRTSPRCWRRRLCPGCRKSPSHRCRRDNPRSFIPTSIMKPSSSSSSSSPSLSSSSSDTRLLSSSSPPPLPCLSLRSPELQAQFLQECRNRFGSHGEDGVFSSPSSPSSSSPSSPPSSTGSPSSYSSSPPPSGDSKRDRLSLSSPELLSELKQSRSRSLRRVPAHNGMTTVFRGRGRGGQALGPAPSTGSANQKTGGRETDRRSDHRT